MEGDIGVVIERGGLDIIVGLVVEGDIGVVIERGGLLVVSW